MHTCCTWLLLYAPPSHLPSICPFTRPYVLISALSMYLPPVLWAWVRAPAIHIFGARILSTLTTSTPPAAFSALPQHLSSPFSVIVLSSQYLFQRGPIWVPALFAVPARFGVPVLFAVPKLFKVTATEVAETKVNVGAVTAERDAAVERLFSLSWPSLKVLKWLNTW